MARSRREPQGVTMPPGRRIPRKEEPRPERAPMEPSAIPADLAKAGAELASLVGTIRACESCSRASGHRVFGSGYPRAPVFLLKDQPSQDDVRAETAFSAEADPLSRAFHRLGIPLGWVYGSTAVRCGTVPATVDAVRACASHLLVEIEAVRPRVIVAFGDRALDAVRALEGRCGMSVPDHVEHGEAVGIRPDLKLLWTEPLPAGLRDDQAKRRLWKDLRTLPDLIR